MSSTITPSLTITSVPSTPAAGGHVQTLPAGTTISTVTVKQERHDEAEIQELAAKMVEAQKAAMAKQAQQQQLASRQVPAGQNIPPNSSGQANILNYLTRKPTNGQNGKGPGSPSPDGSEKKTCDEESQKGHFGWATFGKIYIPYIARQSEKYCAVRMVEMKLLNKYLSYLHPDIYSSCTCVRSYYITEAESRLLNEINHKHCDAQFGRELFTLKDLVVRLSDATKFYQFLDICYRKLLTGSKSPSDKCGFIRINKESVVPYTVRNCEQVVPLFYFEGETENLRQKADYLSGWDLAYLKFCCKVQGIRNELFSSESVAVISLTDIKSYFPNGTEFEDYWPSKVVDSNLLIATKNPGNSVHWTRQPTAPPPKVINTNTNPPKTVQQQVRKPPYTPNIQNPNGGQRMHAGPIPQTSQTGITAAVQALANGWSIAQAQAQAQSALPSVLTPAQTEQLFRAAAAQVHTQQQQQQQNQRNYAAANNRNQLSNMMAGRQQYNTYNNGGMTMTTLNCSQTQQPPPLVRSASQNPAHMLNCASSLPNIQRSNSCDPNFSINHPAPYQRDKYVDTNAKCISNYNNNNNTNGLCKTIYYNNDNNNSNNDNNNNLPYIQYGTTITHTDNSVLKSNYNENTKQNDLTRTAFLSACDSLNNNTSDINGVGNIVSKLLNDSSSTRKTMNEKIEAVVRKVLSNPALSTYVTQPAPMLSPIYNSQIISPPIQSPSQNFQRQTSVICSTSTIPSNVNPANRATSQTTPTRMEVIDLSSPRRSTVAAAANAALQHHQQQQQQQQQQQRMVVANSMQNGRTSQQNQGIPSAAMHLQRQAAASVAASQQRLSVIPEYPTGSAHVAPYKVQKVFVSENTMVPCINMKAYNDSDQLMTLTDFKEYFYPQVSLDQCKKFIEALGVEMYKGNRRQIQTLIENGKPHSENIPLIKVHDIIKFMPQLRYMMRNHQEQQPPNKRTRIS